MHDGVVGDGVAGAVEVEVEMGAVEVEVEVEVGAVEVEVEVEVGAVEVEVEVEVDDDEGDGVAGDDVDGDAVGVAGQKPVSVTSKTVYNPNGPLALTRAEQPQMFSGTEHVHERCVTQPDATQLARPPVELKW